MNTGKLYQEKQVGGGSDGYLKMARDAYEEWQTPEYRAEGDDVLNTLNPYFWNQRLNHDNWASGTIIRHACGFHKTYNGNEMTYDAPARMALAGHLGWLDAMKAEAERAASQGTKVWWYWGKMGVGSLDEMAYGIVGELPGTHIIDNSHGENRKWPFRMKYWAEPFPSDTLTCLERGSLCFARNLRLEGGDQRLATTLKLIRDHGYGAIISCFTPEDFEWLMGTDVAKLTNDGRNTPTWRILLESGISLAFRGDERKVDTALGGKLNELREVAGE